MPKITFLNTNQVIDAKANETILDAALAHDVPIQHACGGFCACTTCHIKVVSGQDQLAPIEEMEEERIASVDGLEPRSRLACQARVLGDVTVEIVNLD